MKKMKYYGLERDEVCVPGVLKTQFNVLISAYNAEGAMMVAQALFLNKIKHVPSNDYTVGFYKNLN